MIGLLFILALPAVTLAGLFGAVVMSDIVTHLRKRKT